MVIQGGGRFLEDGGHLPEDILPGSTQPTAGAGALRWRPPLHPGVPPEKSPGAHTHLDRAAIGCSASSACSMPGRRVHPCASWITQSAATAWDEAAELCGAPEGPHLRKHPRVWGPRIGVNLHPQIGASLHLPVLHPPSLWEWGVAAGVCGDGDEGGLRARLSRGVPSAQPGEFQVTQAPIGKLSPSQVQGQAHPRVEGAASPLWEHLLTGTGVPARGCEDPGILSGRS